MAKIGNWGSYLKFMTSDETVLTFTDMTRKGTVRVAKHNLINRKPELEFIGPDLQTVTFKMELNALLGTRPRKQEEKLYKKMNAGAVAPLVIGGRKVLSRAIITGISSAYNIVIKRGEVLSMTLNITMTVYH